MTRLFCKGKASLLALCLIMGGSAAQAAPDDLADVPFEELVQRDVVWASKLAQQVSDSPAAVSIVTAADIRAYGYRTLADVINSMRGLFTAYDRRYQYMGGRGFGAPEDYSGRIMLLIDGYATQDSLFNQAYIDDSGLIDMALVERVEYVPGTGSVTYGNNALLGIINVVTRNGRDFNGTQFSTELSSHGGKKGRATLGKHFDNGTDLLLSASVLDVKGQNLYFPAYDTPANNNGIADGLDGESNKRVFGKLSSGGWLLEGGFVDRKKDVPTNPSSFTEFNTPFTSQDTNAFVNLRYESDIGLKLHSASRVYLGYYAYDSFRQYADYSTDNLKFGRRQYEGRWWGLEQKFVANWFSDHAIVFGAEFRNDYTQNFYRSYFSPGNEKLSDDTQNFSRTTSSFYLTDEYRVSEQWSLNVGARYDKASDLRGNVSPRVALIYRPSLTTTLKASYSEAFRMPHAYEKYYFRTAAKPEYVRAAELNVQQDFTSRLRFVASLYRYSRRDQLIYSDTVGDYVAKGSSQADGLEFELQGSWENGIRSRGSVAFQHARDTNGDDLANSPGVLGKFNLTFPMFADTLRTGFEAQYIGPRKTLEQRSLGGLALANLTFSSERKWHGFSASFSIRNLFDRNYEMGSLFDWRPASGIPQDSLMMDGRTYWVQLNYDL